MDIDQVEAAIRYHGKELYDILAKANDLEPAQQDSSTHSSDEPKCSTSTNASERELSYQTNSDLAQYKPNIS